MSGGQKKFSNMVDAFSESDMSDVEEVNVDLEKSQDCCDNCNQKSVSSTLLVDTKSLSTNQVIGVSKDSTEEESSSDSDDLFFPIHKGRPKSPTGSTVPQGLGMWTNSYLESSRTGLTEDPILESEDSLSNTTLIPVNKGEEGTTSDKPITIDESIIESGSIPTSSIFHSS